MSVQIWSNMEILVGPYDISCKSTAIDVKAQCEDKDTTPLCVTDNWMSYIGGRKSYSISLDGNQDMTLNEVDTQAWAILGTAGVPMSIMPSAIVDGSLGYTSQPLQTQYTPIDGANGDLAPFKLSAKGNSPLVRGLLLHPNGTARTSSGSGTARQLGAVSASQRMYAALHVFSAGTGSMTVKLQSDNASNFPSAADQITFTAATAGTYQWSSVAGAITDDWWRANWTISGGAPSFLFCLIAGISAA